MVGRLDFRDWHLFDSLSYLLAALLVFLVNAPPEQTRVRSAEAEAEPFSWQTFRREWQDGLALIFQRRIL